MTKTLHDRISSNNTLRRRGAVASDRPCLSWLFITRSK